jgi:hypothetical protein
VLVERLEPDVLIALPLHELPGAGAHRGRAAERLVPHLLEVLLGEDGEEHEAFEEQGERLVGDELDRLGVDDLDFLDCANVAVLRRLLLLFAGLQHPVERELHVLGRHGRAIVELDTLAELELPRRVVQRLPRRGERGLELELRAPVQEGIEHVDVHEDADALEVHVWVQGRRMRGERDGERVLGLGGRGRGDTDGREQGQNQDAGKPTHHRESSLEIATGRHRPGRVDGRDDTPIRRP